MKEIKRSIKFAEPYLIEFAGSVILSLILALASSAPPLVIKYVIDRVLIEKRTNELFILAAFLIFVTGIKGLSAYGNEILREKISNKIILDIREALFEHMQKLSFNYFSSVEAGQIVSRFTNDSIKVQQMLTFSIALITEGATVIFLLGFTIYLNKVLAAVVFLILILIGYMQKRLSARVSISGAEVQENVGIINGVVQEFLLGLRVVKAFGAEEFEVDKFNDISRKNYNSAMRNVRARAKSTPIIEIINSFAVAGFIVAGGIEVINGRMSPGDIVAFLSALTMVYTPIKKIVAISNGIYTNIHSAERIFELLDIIPEMTDRDNALELKSFHSDTEFKELFFTYDNSDREILRNINLKIKKGEKIALVGRSGSGKTTLVNLIPRFYDVKKGSIKIDGTDIKNLQIKSLRKHIGVVMQETFIFSGNINDNIAYGIKNPSQSEIRAAAEMANVTEFADKMEKGLDTDLGERGVLLSGGQKQRIAIARALMRNPEILILDEATSALDTESERYVQDALDRAMRGRTTFIIAHRLSTVMNADRIVVLDDGEIAETGTHEELLLKNGLYKMLYDSQFS